MLSERLIQKIEDHFRRETGRAVCYLPTARLGIYATLCEMFFPGEKLIITPVTDDIVLFAVLAAGLKPVFIDIHRESGGLRTDTIQTGISAGASGIFTSNLYGIPDDARAIRQICDQHGLTFVEDCAHALGATVGDQKIGTFGDVSLYSLAKHIGGQGGIVTSKDPEKINAIKKRAEPFVVRQTRRLSTIESFRFITSDALSSLPVIRAFTKKLLYPLLGLLPNPYAGKADDFERIGHRVPITPADFHGWEKRKPFEDYDRYIRVDNIRYRKIPCWYLLWKNLMALRNFSEKAPSYRSASARFDPRMIYQMGRPLSGTTACYFKLPVFTENRDFHYDKMTERGMEFHAIFDPPFTNYLPHDLFINCVTDEAACLRWSRKILPVSLKDTDQVSEYISLNKKEFAHAPDLQSRDV